LACATLAGAFGGAIAFAVGHMNRAGGLQAWRWLFILEGTLLTYNPLAASNSQLYQEYRLAYTLQ